MRLLLLLLLVSADVFAVTRQAIPGASRSIGDGLSASRDASFPSWQYLPRETRAGGAGIALGKLQFPHNSLRVGISGMVEIESDVDTLPALPNKRHSVKYWRGLFGFTTAFSFERCAEKTFGRGSNLEVAASIHHESSHDVDVAYWYFYAPIIGDFVQTDAALRLPWKKFVCDTRISNRYFFGPKFSRNYDYGPGAEVILRWKATRAVHPFTSHYFEYLVGFRRPMGGGVILKVPDNQYYRNLFGVTFPGRFADLAFYASYMTGNQRGQQAFKEQNSWGWGMRIVLFGSD